MTWPSLTPEALNKYYTRAVYTAKGHLDQERKNLQSTKSITVIPLSPEEEILQEKDFFPDHENLDQPTHNCMAIIQTFKA